jgi:hypothetical protein
MSKEAKPDPLLSPGAIAIERIEIKSIDRQVDALLGEATLNFLMEEIQGLSKKHFTTPYKPSGASKGEPTLSQGTDASRPGYAFEEWWTFCVNYANKQGMDDRVRDGFIQLLESLKIPDEARKIPEIHPFKDNESKQMKINKALIEIEASVVEWGLSSAIRGLANILGENLFEKGTRKLADKIDAFVEMVKSIAGYDRCQKIDKQVDTVVDVARKKESPRRQH